MHFLINVTLLVAGLVGFAVLPSIRRKPSIPTTSINGVNCDFKQQRASRSNRVTVTVAIPCDERFEFTLRRERITDRLAKALHLIHEFQTLDERFDEVVYIGADERGIGEWLAQDSEARRQFLDLLTMELSDNTRVTSVTASRGVLTLSALSKPPMFASASADLGMTVATASVLNLKSCLDRLHAFAVADIDPSAFRDPYATAIRTLNSLSIGLLVVPLMLSILLNFQSPPVALAADPFGDKHTYMTMAGAVSALGALGFLLLRGSARLHTVLTRLLLLGALGTVFVVPALINEVNTEWDHTIPLHYSAQVLRRYITHGRNSTYHHVWLSDWHLQHGHQDLLVDASKYDSLSEGDIVTVLEHEGYLGKRWVSDVSR